MADAEDWGDLLLDAPAVVLPQPGGVAVASDDLWAELLEDQVPLAAASAASSDAAAVALQQGSAADALDASWAELLEGQVPVAAMLVASSSLGQPSSPTDQSGGWEDLLETRGPAELQQPESTLPGRKCTGRDSWADHVASQLQGFFRAWWDSDSCYQLRFASDCSGAESSWWALQDLLRALRSLGVLDLSVAQEYGSEHPGQEGDAPRKFLHRNCQVKRMFRDMHLRVLGQGPVDWVAAGIEVATVTGEDGVSAVCAFVPDGPLDLYVGGFVCRDNSSANRHRRKDPGHSGAGSRNTSGQSFSTYSSSKQAIQKERPLRFVLENVGHCPAEPTVQDLRDALPDYFVMGFKTEACHFFSWTRRLRVFIVGTLKSITATPPQDWAAILAQLGAPPTSKAHQLLLQPDDPSIYQAFANMRCSASAPAGAGQPGEPSHAAERQWMAEHAMVREELGSRAPLQPTLEQVQEQAPTTGLTNVRELDLRNLLWAVAERDCGNPETLDLYWDVSAEASHRWNLSHESSGSAPCMLASHKLYSTRLGRCLLGSEHLMLQLFPADLDFSCCSDRELRQLAGLSMNVAQVGAIIGLTLAVTAHGCSVPEEVLSQAKGLPAVQVVKPHRRQADPRTMHLPGLDRKGKNSELQAQAAQVMPWTIRWRQLKPRAAGMQTAQTFSEDPVADLSQMQDADRNAVDLTTMLCQRLEDPQKWAVEVATAVEALQEPVVVLGLQCEETAACLADVGQVSEATLRYQHVCTRLVFLLRMALASLQQDSAAAVTCIRIQKHCQTAGIARERAGNKRCLRRYFQLAWRSDRPALASPVSRDGRPDIFNGDLWLEEQGGSVSLGPLAGSYVRFPWGRWNIDAAGKLRGNVYSSAGRLLSFRPNFVKIQDMWPEPALHCSVEWRSVSFATMKQAAARSDVLAVLASLGFWDPAVSLEGRIALLDKPVPPLAASESAQGDDWEELLA